MSYTQPLDLIAGAVLTAPGGGVRYGAPVFVGRNRDLALALGVSSLSSGGTLDLAVETAPSSQATRWRSLDAFPQVVAAGSSPLALSGADAWVRAAWSLSSSAEAVSALAGDARLVLRASASSSAAGTSTPVDVGQYRALRLALDVTAGAGSLVVSVQTAQQSNATTWTTVPGGTFAAATAAGEKLLTVGDLQRWVRLSWTMATGPFTFGVSGTTHLVYASPADRTRFGVRGGAIPDTADVAKVLDALIITAPTISMYLKRWELPLRDWDDTIREAHIAAADLELLTSRGGEPGAPGTELYVGRYREWFGEPPQRMGKLDLIRKGELTPCVVDSAEPDTTTGQIGRSVVASRPRRGWDDYNSGIVDPRRGY